ncbi:transfer protein [Streptomyces sp. NPDC059853]|uniref:transfer protein n=1 Tax=Streptomyces sp. NPDC059853 TaxID=3346973 RepID=UPI00366A2A2E
MSIVSLADVGRQTSVTELLLRTPPGGVSRIDLAALADSLGVDDPSRIVLQQASGEALIRIYPTNPLAQLVPATSEDLVMRGGRIVAGRYYDGAPAHLRLYDPGTGNAQRICIFGTTGAGKSRSLQLFLAACKRNNVVVHLADLKEGQSVPEAVGNVATRVTTQRKAILMLRGVVAEANDRMRRYGELGRSGFLLGRPDPLMYAVLDEGNRLLEKGARYRAEATRLIREIGRTGRSVGVGVVLAAQAGHLEELGGSDTLRSMLKEGEVILLRWSSGMMQSLVADGLLPSGVRLQPIPKVIGVVKRIRRYDEAPAAGEERPNSQGMAYHLTSARPDAMMRWSMVGSLEPCEGHDPAILDLYGPGDAPGDPIDLAAFDWRDEDEDGGDGTPGGSRSPGGSSPTGPAMEAAPPVPAAPRRLPDRIVRALEDGGPLDGPALLDALHADGGRAVRPGSVRNALSELRSAGRITSEGGVHSLT